MNIINNSHRLIKGNEQKRLRIFPTRFKCAKDINETMNMKERNSTEMGTFLFVETCSFMSTCKAMEIVPLKNRREGRREKMEYEIEL